ncbi:N-acetylmannosamine-6-phosphate 2-epimerase [Pseudothermotoga thermarum]|uniref:N-acylglucosamine-6-phosphate 2-epimerase n=1 Tax=Pseudothermotoga thermarum DSM 5069 TaxID=688269 RepID=F7YVC1_9THEM|nr:putative N-acetylmannosamine-6-phosphate 2-epimerase [Pseudothermotoga thermarum]AEH50424.1 N-acylglucosamine-6-phosphate 2-epimerase [Pseudothermotoga thermarum DSM 5069]
MRQIPRGIIISCQLEPGDPIEDVCFVVSMAKAAKYAGAVAIRTNEAKHVRAIKESLDIPVIGLVKDRNYKAFITPTFEHAKQVIEAGADLVAIDCTRNERPVELDKLFEQIRLEFPNVGIVADIADELDAERVQSLKPDFIATTLCGYTSYTQGWRIPNLDLVKKLSKKLFIPIIAEGGYSTVEEVEKAFEYGAYAVVIGTAITRPWLTIQRFVRRAQPFL